MLTEVKTSDHLDFFTDPPYGNALPECLFTIDIGSAHPGYGEARYVVSTLGQSTCYVHIAQTRQFRTCVYSISVAGTTPRLLRWDRSGVIVTESFNCKTNPENLIGLVWRFSKATNN